MPQPNPTSKTTMDTLLKTMCPDMRYICPRDIMPADLAFAEVPQPICRSPRKRDRKSTRRVQIHRASTAARVTTSLRKSSLYYLQCDKSLTQEVTQEESSWMEEVEYRAAAQFSDFPVGCDELQLPAMSSNREAIDVQVEYVSSMSLVERERYYSAPGARPQAHAPGCRCWRHEKVERRQSRNQSPTKPNFASQVALYDVLEQQKVQAAAKRLGESSRMNGY